jgi:hypothetical protein
MDLAKNWYRDPLTCVLLVLLVLTFGCVAVAAVGIEPIQRVKGEVWAAWVQAVGSIGAILVAIAVAAHQGRVHSKAAQAAAEAERSDINNTVIYLSYLAKERISEVIAQVDTRAKLEAAAQNGREVVDRNLQDLVSTLTDVPVFHWPAVHIPRALRVTKVLRDVGFKTARALEAATSMSDQEYADFLGGLARDKEAMDIQIEMLRRWIANP